MPNARRGNRGPSAAAENRAALIAAAREVFASNGLEAPLTSIARVAQVGQGSLYRHFPDRISLALAVFEDGVKELEARAAVPGTTLDDMLALVTEQTIASTAFIDMVSLAPTDPRLQVLADRVAGLLAGLLTEAQQAGRIRPEITTGDLMLAIGMLAGILSKKPPSERRDTADQAWRLIRSGLGGPG